MSQFITALRLELLILMHSQIFWGWEGKFVFTSGQPLSCSDCGYVLQSFG